MSYPEPSFIPKLGKQFFRDRNTVLIYSIQEVYLDPAYYTEIWRTVSRLGTLNWQIIQKLGKQFPKTGNMFSFTGSGLSTWIWTLYRNWEKNFQRLGTWFSVTGSRLSTRIWHIIQNLRTISGTRNTVFIYWVRVGYPDQAYRNLGKQFSETRNTVLVTWSGLSTWIWHITWKLGRQF